ncbi:MAG: CRISPR system precrRNA processing endoribonuclease RAMP protein Cas6 [candidate division KSB1 bacterium]|nr:CRISPR system precrRNA processing endoribonuclease RAMP protein Cas6 [candidate division KSB1 bacterium]
MVTLPELTFAQYQCRLQAVDDLHLAPYKGSTLRGAFGHAFRRVACVEPRRATCQGCLLTGTCPYSRVFESPAMGTLPRFLRGVDRAPHPFVIEPPLAEEQDVPAGGEVVFGLTLFGSACDLLPYFILTFRELGRCGIGKGRGRCTVRSVAARTQAGWQDIYDGKSGTLANLDARQRPPESTAAASALTLRFLTPTRIKHRGHLTDRLDFRLLVFHLLKRASELTHFYCPQAAVQWDFAPALALAAEVTTCAHSLRWVDWERWSNRQQTRMKLGGIVGEISFAGPLGPFLPLLRLGEVMHVGKGTSFGLGKYELHQHP